MRFLSLPEITRLRFAAVLAGLCLCLLLPVLMYDYPIAWDYLNHLARMHVLLHLPDNPYFQRMYGIDWHPVPNLAFDVTTLALSRFMPLADAGRVFIVLTVLLLPLGIIALHRIRHGALSWWPFVAFVFAWHGGLAAGMVNYAFAVALLPWVAAAWLYCRPRLGACHRAALFSAAALLLYFCHIYAFALWGVWLIAEEWSHTPLSSWRDLHRRRAFVIDWLAAGVQALLPCLLFFYTSGLASSGGEISYARALPIKLHGFGFTYDAFTGIIFSQIVMMATVAIAALALWQKWLRLHRTEAITVCVLTLGYVLLPPMAFENYATDTRLLIVLIAFFIAGSAPSPSVPAWLKHAVPYVFLALFLHKTYGQTAQLAFYAEELHRYRHAFSTIEPGARVLSAMVRFDEDSYSSGNLSFSGPQPTPSECTPPHPPKQDAFFAYRYRNHLNFAGAFAVIDRSAFFAHLYTHPGKQPLRTLPPYDAISEPGDALPIACRVIASVPEARTIGKCKDASHCYWRHWTVDFDYLLLLDPQEYDYRPTHPALHTMHEDRFFRLYRIRHPG